MNEPAEDGRVWPRLSPLSTGVRGRCPRCGQGHLFSGFLTIAPRCEVCGLDFSYVDTADGPAFFVMMFGCVPVVILAIMLEVRYQASLTTHLLLTLPFGLATCILPLRPLKGWLAASQFTFKAREGRLWRPGDPD
ncbi:MAG: DUF983 domain-containing protein [Phreatobacter sp.]|jgi:uncharacterized protein (DUF983 family)|uniref:DUF983 domain-containing protein n=1 Tax=Phreatobacter sp. TaxID=1966341 RepID=UPI0040356AEB